MAEKEHIEREAAKNALCKLCRDISNWRMCEQNDECNLICRIDGVPAADARPVVLCRDCKNNYNTCLNHGRNEPMCDFTDRKLKEDDFCSRGEKREES